MVIKYPNKEKKGTNNHSGANEIPELEAMDGSAVQTGTAVMHRPGDGDDRQGTTTTASDVIAARKTWNVKC